MWLPIHDELVLHVPDPLVERVMAEVEQCRRFDFMGVPIGASAVPLREPDGTSRAEQTVAALTSGGTTLAPGRDHAGWPRTEITDHQKVSGRGNVCWA